VNIERLKTIVNHIKAHPETWDQSAWICETAYCLAGHAAVDAGYERGDDDNLDIAVKVPFKAEKYLDLNKREARYLFDYERTIEDFDAFIAKHEQEQAK
jgi:hypothetical protein